MDGWRRSLLTYEGEENVVGLCQVIGDLPRWVDTSTGDADGGH